MKKVRCPRCDNFISFDETKFQNGSSPFFECHHCGRKFGIKLKTPNKTDNREACGSITVLENGFCHKQELPLFTGQNVIGRRSRGNDIEVPIETGDPSIGRNHCIIDIKRKKDGSLLYVLRDFPSLTGTFIGNYCLGKNERVNLDDFAVVTCGATTFIVNQKQEELTSEEGQSAQ